MVAEPLFPLGTCVREKKAGAKDLIRRPRLGGSLALPREPRAAVLKPRTLARKGILLIDKGDQVARRIADAGSILF
jgi:hypothetical protein